MRSSVPQRHRWNPGNHCPPRNPYLNTFVSPSLFDPTGFSNEASLAGLEQQDQSSGATANNQGSTPLSGIQMMGGRWVSEKVSKPEAYIAAILGMVSLLIRPRFIKRPSVSNLLRPIAGYQGFFYKHQSLPRLNHRQLMILRQSHPTRDLKPSLVEPGLRPQTTKQLKGDSLFPHLLQTRSI